MGLGSSEYRDLVRDSGQEDSYLGTAISAALGRIAFVAWIERTSSSTGYDMCIITGSGTSGCHSFATR